MDTGSSAEWVGYFRQLVEKVVADDEVTKRAIDGIVAACGEHVSPSDAPATAIGRIMEANRQLKLEALKILHEFITVNG